MATRQGKCSKKRRCSGSSFSSNSSSTDDATTAKRLKRQVQVSKFEKWQQELDKEHNTLLWLFANRTEGSGYLSLHCIAKYVENMKTK